MLNAKSLFSPLDQPLIRVPLLMVFAMLGLLSGVTGSAHAQNAPWTAWLYNDAAGSLLQIDSSGNEVNELILPLAQGFNGYGRPVVISPSGRYIAYTAFDSTQEPASVQLFVYDQAIGAFRFTYDITGSLATGLDYALSPLAFDENAGHFAFGYLTASEGWQVVVGDFATSSPLATLDAASGASVQGNNPVPVVQRLNGSTVTFTAVPHGSENQVDYPAYQWNFVSGEVTPDSRYTSLLVDTDPATGQVAAARYDPDQAGADGGSSFNVVDIITAGGESARLYNETDGTIHQVRFIENGARILLEVQNASDNQTHLRVLNRDGSVAGEIVGSLDHLTGTPDGFIGTFNSGGATAIASIDTTAATLAPVTLWSGAPGTAYTLLRVIPG